MSLEDIEKDFTERYSKRLPLREFLIQMTKMTVAVYLTCLTLCVVHELGHAFMATLLDMRVVEIMVNPIMLTGYVDFQYFSYQIGDLVYVILAGGVTTGIVFFILFLRLRDKRVGITSLFCFIYAYVEFLLMSNMSFVILYMAINLIAMMAMASFWADCFFE